MGMSCEQKINILENKVDSDVLTSSRCRISIFLIKNGPGYQVEKMVVYNGKYPKKSAERYNHLLQMRMW